MSSSLTSFEPADAGTSPAMTTGGDPSIDPGAPPKTATLTSDQLSAFGLDGAAPGTQYTINITVGDVSDTGTSVTVDDSSPADDGTGADPDMAGADPTQDAMADLPPPSPPPMTPPKPKPAVVGPNRLKKKFGMQ